MGVGGVDGGSLKEVMEQSRYQSQQTAPLLSNEQEGLVNKLAKEPPQLVMETRPTAAGASDWLSQRPGRSRASSAGKVSTPRARPRKRKKKKNQYCAIPLSVIFFFAAGRKKNCFQFALCPVKYCHPPLRNLYTSGL